MLLDVLLPPLHESSNRGGSGIEHRHLVAIHDRPKAIGPRLIWRPFIDHVGPAVAQYSVDHVAVAGDPANIRGTPVSVAFP